MDEIAALLSLQDGVISRRQVLSAGLQPHAIERLLRRREWVAVHPGVYVDHTGPLSWRQRAWAAVLACWPPALDGQSSLRAHEGRGRRGRVDGPIAVLVAHRRHLTPPDGVEARRSRRFDEQVSWNLNPPRMSYDDTVIEIADTAPRELDVIAALADACGGRRTNRGAARRPHRRDPPPPPALVARQHPRRRRDGHLLGAGAPLPHRRRAGPRSAARPPSGPGRPVGPADAA
jgi:hypothetical protein